MNLHSTTNSRSPTTQSVGVKNSVCPAANILGEITSGRISVLTMFCTGGVVIRS